MHGKGERSRKRQASGLEPSQGQPISPPLFLFSPSNNYFLSE